MGRQRMCKSMFLKSLRVVHYLEQQWRAFSRPGLGAQDFALGSENRGMPDNLGHNSISSISGLWGLELSPVFGWNSASPIA